MTTSTQLETELSELLPALRNRLDPTKALAQNGIDSIDLVDLLCVVQTRYCCDLSPIRIDDTTTYAGLLAQLTEIINERSPSQIVCDHSVS